MDFSLPYLLAFLIAIPTVVLAMGLFGKKQFVVEGRVSSTPERVD
jgi:hypothetical protein